MPNPSAIKLLCVIRPADRVNWCFQNIYIPFSRISWIKALVMALSVTMSVNPISFSGSVH